jgi:hypothetical protein
MTELRKRGVGSAVICSGPFVKLGQAQSRVFGVPDLPLIVIPHPLGGIALDEVRGRAEVAIPKLINLLKEHAR